MFEGEEGLAFPNEPIRSLENAEFALIEGCRWIVEEGRPIFKGTPEGGERARGVGEGGREGTEGTLTGRSEDVAANVS